MTEQSFYTTVQYRNECSYYSLDFLQHKGKKCTAKVLAESIELFDNITGDTITVPIKDITKATIGHGVICLITKDTAHVLDFAASHHEGVFSDISAGKRSKVMAGHLEAAGVKLKSKFF